MSDTATKIIGVDFSGAVTNQNTWVCEGMLHGETLCVESCLPITREDLAGKLAGMREPMIAAMDFPFGLPIDFVNKTYPSKSKGLGVWSISRDDSLWKDFEKFAREFNGNRFRLCDETLNKKIKSAGVKSPLATSPRNMLPMTFRGMQMLHWLKRKGFNILPFDDCSSINSERILMEVMPGATLRALKLNLPYKAVKTEKSARNSRKNRAEILFRLPNKSRIRVHNIEQFRPYALNFDDCLDAIVAAVTAAMWLKSPKQFILPPREDDPKFRRIKSEGWLYVPDPTKLPA